MKRTISLILVAAMLVCAMIIAPATTSAVTLDTQNVGVEAYYFGGTLVYAERYGALGSTTAPDSQTVKTGDASKGTITLDGIINDGEWGAPNISISSAFAADNAGKKDVTNAKFETASAENSYYYYAPGTAVKDLGFTAYFLWDEDYFYVASHVVDPDNHLGSNSGDAAWDGDAFQFRVDYQGPNSVVDGTGYTAADSAFPWKGSVRAANGGEKYSDIGNFIFSYTTANGGYTECWDAAARWNVTTDETTGELIGIQSGIDYMAGNGDDLTAYAVAFPRTEKVDGVNKYITEYEIAIPWTLIDSVYAPTGYTAAAGNELGMSIALLNGARGESTYNSYLEWGSGVCGSRTTNDPLTCGGSNSVTLSAVAYTDTANQAAYVGCNHDFADPTCVVPYKCTECGYEKGFVAGHDYDYSGVTLPTATTAGTITATCPVCGDTYTQTLAATDVSISHELKTTDTSFIDKGFNDGWSTNWTDVNDTILFNNAGVAVTSFNNTTFDYAVVDGVTNGSQYGDVGEKTYHDQTGTYFATEDDVGTSYTSKMDIYFTGFEDKSPWTYTPGVYYMFGGSAVDYVGGIFKLDNRYFFAIIATSKGTELNTKDGTIILTPEQFMADALSYTEVPAETVALDTWHEFVFVHDQNSATALIYWDDVLVASATDPHLAYTNNKASVVMRRFGVPFYAKDVVVGSTSLANEYIPTGGHTLTVNYKEMVEGVATDKQATVTLAEGATYDVSSLSFYLLNRAYSYRFSGWTGDTATLANATHSSKGQATTFTMPATDATITADYIMVGDVYEDGSWNGKDSNKLTQIVAGSADPVLSADINYDNSFSGKDGNLMLQIVSAIYVPVQ